LTLKSFLRNPEVAGAPEAGSGLGTWLRRYFSTKARRARRTTKGFETHPELVAPEHVFVQLHTNTVRVPLALKPGGVLLTKNLPA
jgi:hypothetical protein